MVTELLDAAGQLVAVGEPDAQGRIRGVSCPLKGLGQYADAESGLLYTRHRYFDPEIEQFVSADPLGIGPSENTYRLGPNLWGWVDPLGGAGMYMSSYRIRNRLMFPVHRIRNRLMFPVHREKRNGDRLRGSLGTHLETHVTHRGTPRDARRRRSQALRLAMRLHR
jgi:RHS repeat-associated protein